jgi:dTDP-4-amino-4,6-dideoxygalactose transaminase
MAPWGGADLPGTGRAAREHLAIPLHPSLTREQAEAVTRAVAEATAR